MGNHKNSKETKERKERLIKDILNTMSSFFMSTSETYSRVKSFLEKKGSEEDLNSLWTMVTTQVSAPRTSTKYNHQAEVPMCCGTPLDENWKCKVCGDSYEND